MVKMEAPKPRKNNSEGRGVVIIINSSLVNGEIHQKLEANPFCRIRVSQSTEKNSIILPGKSIALMVMAVTEMTNTWPPSGERWLNEDAAKRIEKFYKIHRNCYLLLLTRLTTNTEFNVLREVQKRFWKSPLIIYPVSGAKQCIRILDQVSNSSRDTQDAAEYSGIQRGHLPEKMVQNILENNIGVSTHQSLVLLDSCHNIANIACYTADDLMERSPLSREIAKKVELFFEKDCVNV